VYLSTIKSERRIILSKLSKLSDFGLLVKTELLKKRQSQKWLEEEITKRTGLYVDNGYLHKIFTGQRNAPKIVEAICEILNIEKEGE
jgi:hypothetical protein